jgi:diguanylate cyclase (GGDEF)-like protein
MSESASPLCDRFGITPDEMRTRLSFLGLTAHDEPRLAEIRSLIAHDVDAIVREFYDHLMSFPDAAALLSDERRLARQRKILRDYLLGLGDGFQQVGYWEHRLRIGVAHERIDLDQKWYLGAYAHLSALIEKRLLRYHRQDPPSVIAMLESLHKIFTLDSTLAVHTYYQSALKPLEESFELLASAQAALEKAARHDSLTRIYNRSALMESLAAEFERSRRFTRSLSILFLDVDHFKDINDTHSHAFGDVVLRRLIEIVRAGLRSADVIGRYGGEEFLVGLVETNLSEARVIAERIRLLVSQTRIESSGTVANVTISIGVSERRSTDSRIEQMIERADHALYRAKHAGRNCVSDDGDIEKGVDA